MKLLKFGYSGHWSLDFLFLAKSWTAKSFFNHGWAGFTRMGRDAQGCARE
jgi:hypothetical protein